MAQSKNIDFSNVKDGGSFNRKRIPAGDYLATITKVDDAEAKDGVFQYLVSIKINKHPASVFPYYCKLQENQLWKLRNLLIAAGMTVPKRRFKVDPARLVNKIIGVTVEDDEYDGKEQSTIAGIYPAAELGDVDASETVDDSEEEAAEDDLGDEFESTDDEAEEEAEEEAEPEVDPVDAMDRTALKAELKRLDATFVAKKSQSDDDLRGLLRSKLSDGDSQPEDDEEEEEAPPATTATKRATKPAATVSDDELEELNIDDI